MNSIRAVVKISVQLVVIFFFVIFSLFAKYSTKDPVRRRRLHTRIASFFSYLTLKVMGVHLRVIGSPPDPAKNYMLVCNHLGFIDIFIVSTVFPALFITSVDMRETPGLGAITEMGGCMYVERRNRFNIHQEIVGIRQGLAQGLSVVLFPEAAAMSGEKIYPFKKTLMTATVGTEAEILPAVLNFRKINGEPMSHKWRDSVFWYGPTPFAGIAWRAFQLKSIEVEFEFLKPIRCESEDSRSVVANHAQAMVESKYAPIPFPHEPQTMVQA